jgi:hypothetical protein
MPWTYEENFKTELNNLTTAQHKNIIQLIGFCRHTEQIVVPYEGNNVCGFVPLWIQELFAWNTCRAEAFTSTFLV